MKFGCSSYQGFIPIQWEWHTAERLPDQSAEIMLTSYIFIWTCVLLCEEISFQGWSWSLREPLELVWLCAWLKDIGSLSGKVTLLLSDGISTRNQWSHWSSMCNNESRLNHGSGRLLYWPMEGPLWPTFENDWSSGLQRFSTITRLHIAAVNVERLVLIGAQKHGAQTSPRQPPNGTSNLCCTCGGYFPSDASPLIALIKGRKPFNRCVVVFKM